MNEIPPLPKRTRGLGAEVVAHLADQLRGQTLRPGDRLPSERMLSEGLGVSRATVRQALVELEARGLVIRRHGLGTIVAEPGDGGQSLADILDGVKGDWKDVADLEDLVEPGIARRAARRASEAAVLHLERLVERERGAADSDEASNLDEEFHLALADMAANPLLRGLAAGTCAASANSRRLVHETSTGSQVAAAGHRAVLEAVRSRDGSAAEAAMARHLEEVRRVVRDAQRRA